MSIPNDEDLMKFRKQLDDLSIDTIKEKLRHHHYGMKDSWKTKEAEARIKREEDVAEYKFKNTALKLQAEGNNIAQQANTLARRALWISLIALALSILVAIFK